MRAPGGRLSVAHEFQPLQRFYIPLALAVVAGAFAIVRLSRPDDRYLQGEVLYGSIALVWIAIPAWLAYKHGRWVPSDFKTFVQAHQSEDALGAD